MNQHVRKEIQNHRLGSANQTHRRRHNFMLTLMSITRPQSMTEKEYKK